KFKVDMTAGNVKKVWLLARRGSLEATMSYYLVERIKAQPNIEVLTRSEVTALEGCDGNLETARWRHCGRPKAAAFSTRALVCGRHIFGWYFPFRVPISLHPSPSFPHKSTRPTQTATGGGQPT